MSKIFLTGMSAPQSSPKLNDKNLSFAGQIYQTLSSVGHDVTWTNPSIYMSKEFLDSYDSVIVGISPIAGLGSDRAYGVLSIIDTMWGDPKLTMFIDSPSLSQLTSNINKYAEEPSELKKPFFSYKKEFSNLVSDPYAFEKVANAVELLKNEDWGTTFYPKLPWNDVSSVKLNQNAKANLHGINLDSIFISEIDSKERVDKWVMESKNPKWDLSITSSLTFPVVTMKTSRKDNDDNVAQQISKAMGSIIAPDSRVGTWWSYRYVQSLSYKIPIITDWKETSVLGEAWELLASNIEGMSSHNRDLVALAQKELYLANVPSVKNAISDLLEKIGILEVASWQK
jgi:hypothetical protein